MPIRIRFLHTRYAHWGQRSGFPQMVRYLDNRRFASALDGASDSDGDLPAWLSPAKPWLRRMIRRGGMPWYKLSDLMAELRAVPGSVGGRYHIVHFLDGEHSGQYLPRLLRRMGVPRPRTVASFHQPHHLQRTLINPDVVRSFDHVTLFSPSQVPVFLEWLPAHRVHLLLHGVDIDFFHPPSAARPAGRRIRCITVGHWLRDWEALRGVAQVFLSDPAVAFDVVTARETGLEDLSNVTHHRGIEDDVLAELYRRADVLLLPLTECTANNALLEGIASGLPVVSSDLQGVRFHLAGHESVLVSPGDVDGLVGALRKLQSEPALRLEMGRRARLRSEELSWSKAVNGFTALYEAIVAEPSSARTGHEQCQSGR